MQNSVTSIKEGRKQYLQDILVFSDLFMLIFKIYKIKFEQFPYIFPMVSKLYV